MCSERLSRPQLRYRFYKPGQLRWFCDIQNGIERDANPVWIKLKLGRHKILSENRLSGSPGWSLDYECESITPKWDQQFQRIVSDPICSVLKPANTRNWSSSAVNCRIVGIKQLKDCWDKCTDFKSTPFGTGESRSQTFNQRPDDLDSKPGEQSGRSSDIKHCSKSAVARIDCSD